MKEKLDVIRPFLIATILHGKDTVEGSIVSDEEKNNDVAFYVLIIKIGYSIVFVIVSEIIPTIVNLILI